MYEVFPVAAGVIVALLVRQVVDLRLRGAIVGVLSIVAGFAAATISGEIEASVAFVLFDAAQFALAAGVTLYAVARWRPIMRK
jgi:hypothetical protein